jgi:23S rRNA pseudouridine1911/1915/1917 synthase
VRHLFAVPPESVGERVDRFVTQALATAGIAVSRTLVQSWCDDGLVQRRGAALRASATLSQGDEILVEPRLPSESPLVPDATVKFEIVYEDADLIVVDKPPHLVVHPAKSHREHTLIHGLLAHGGFEAVSLEDCVRPGVVHRLDKGTSGLLVVAKRVAAREKLKAQFMAHTIDREYVALVLGIAKTATWDTPHGRHPTDRIRFTSLRPAGAARRAVTHVELLATLPSGASVVRCTLETGRTHQIRVHLAERGKTPVLGDPLYGSRPRSPVLARIADGLGRQALHARVLGFEHPSTGRRLRFEREPPADFRQAVEAARAALP